MLHDRSPARSTATQPATAAPSTAALTLGAIVLALVAVLLCLIPKPENDLFFILRIGTDMLRTHHLPHADTYSWTNRGTPWVVPEWLSFVKFAFAYHVAGFFGVWLVLALSTVAMALIVWFYLARRLGAVWGFVIANFMLLALVDFLQERPYTFTYLFLAASLVLVMRAREEGRSRLLLWLPPLCALWTNFHQGVIVLPCLLAAFALGDVPWDRRSAARMLAVAAACALAAMASPYGWRVYWNVYITLRDRTMMSSVTEWKPIIVVPFPQLQAFLLLTAILVLAIVLSLRHRAISPAPPGLGAGGPKPYDNAPAAESRSENSKFHIPNSTFSSASLLPLAALFVESLLHARNIALFVIGAAVIGGPYYAAALERFRASVGDGSTMARNAALTLVGIIYLMTLSAVVVASLKPAVGPRGYTLEGIGEAVARVPSYPDAACAFVQEENFPPNLRLFNNFALGGYLMWRLPSEPVFVDGRLDVYSGKTFDDMLVIDRKPNTPVWQATVEHYDLDCVITTTSRIADAFAHRPDWTVVYVDPKRPHHSRCTILLRRRPEFAALIDRCLHIRSMGYHDSRHG